jgi:hypothetical protein
MLFIIPNRIVYYGLAQAFLPGIFIDKNPVQPIDMPMTCEVRTKTDNFAAI